MEVYRKRRLLSNTGRLRQRTGSGQAAYRQAEASDKPNTGRLRQLTSPIPADRIRTGASRRRSMRLSRAAHMIAADILAEMKESSIYQKNGAKD